MSPHGRKFMWTWQQNGTGEPWLRIPLTTPAGHGVHYKGKPYIIGVRNIVRLEDGKWSSTGWIRSIKPNSISRTQASNILSIYVGNDPENPNWKSKLQPLIDQTSKEYREEFFFEKSTTEKKKPSNDEIQTNLTEVYEELERAGGYVTMEEFESGLIDRVGFVDYDKYYRRLAERFFNYKKPKKQRIQLERTPIENVNNFLEMTCSTAKTLKMNINAMTEIQQENATSHSAFKDGDLKTLIYLHCLMYRLLTIFTKRMTQTKDNLPSLWFYGNPETGKTTFLMENTNLQKLCTDSSGVGRFILGSQQTGFFLDEATNQFLYKLENLGTLKMIAEGQSTQVKIHSSSTSVCGFLFATTNNVPAFVDKPLDKTKKMWYDDHSLALRRRFVTIPYTQPLAQEEEEYKPVSYNEYEIDVVAMSLYKALLDFIQTFYGGFPLVKTYKKYLPEEVNIAYNDKVLKTLDKLVGNDIVTSDAMIVINDVLNKVELQQLVD